MREILKNRMIWITIVISLFIIAVILFIYLNFFKQDSLIGKWETSYELGSLGEVTQIYEFKKDGTCKKTLKTDMNIELNCTYKIENDKMTIEYENDTKTVITIKKEDNGYLIGGYLHKRQK